MNEDLNRSHREALEELRAADRMLRALTPEIEQSLKLSSSFGQRDEDRESPLSFTVQSDFMEAQRLATKALVHVGRSNPNPIIELYNEYGQAHANLQKALEVNRFVRHAFWDIYNQDPELKAQVEPLYCDEDTINLDSDDALVLKKDWSKLNNILIGVAVALGILGFILDLIFD